MEILDGWGGAVVIASSSGKLMRYDEVERNGLRLAGSKHLVLGQASPVDGHSQLH